MLAWLVDVATRASGRDQVLADFTLVIGNIRMGRLQTAMWHADRMAATAKQLREPFLLALPLFGRPCVQVALGRLDEAGRELDALDHLLDGLGDADASAWGPALRMCRAYQAGSLGDYADAAVFAAETFPDNPAWEAAAVGTLAAAGRAAEALQWLDRLATRDFESGRRDAYYTVLLGWTGFAVARLDTEHRARVLELLEDIANVPLCTAGPLNMGSPLQFAGVLRRSMGDLDGAVDRLRQAVTRLEEMGARGYLAQTRAQLAAALAERAQRGDLDEARRIAAAAVTAAKELGTGDVVSVCGDLT
jgi:hypothetical protein